MPSTAAAAIPGRSDADVALREARLRREQGERDRVAELLAAAVAGGGSSKASSRAATPYGGSRR